MPTVTVVQPSDGQTADANDVNSQVNALLAVVNGHIDQDNLADSGVTNAKLAGSIDVSKLAANVGAGWIPGLATPNTVTYNGNRNYSLVFNNTDLTPTLSNGMRLKLTRTVTAPTQCTSLNGSTQYYSKTTPAGMTFTNNFVVSAWVKLSSYANSIVASRYNGTSGWYFQVTSSGIVQLVGLNGGAGNTCVLASYASLPLNKWVHIAAQLDMTTTSVGTTNNYILFDGAEVAETVTRTGTNPTALIQAGDLEIGAANGAVSPFAGKIAQVAIYSAKVAQATIAASTTQTLAGTETSLISAYSFNGVLTDLNANANTLTANGSAVATNVDSPFAGGANASTAYTAGTTEFGEVFNVAFSTNTTVVVQVPDGYAIPTSGGVSAVAYSTQASPLGWPLSGGIISLGQAFIGANFSTTTTPAFVDVSGLSVTVYVPAGRRVKLTGKASRFNSSGTVAITFALREGSTSLDANVASVANTSVGVYIGTVIYPSSGSHTYLVSISQNGAGTLGINAGPTGGTAQDGLASLVVELV